MSNGPTIHDVAFTAGPTRPEAEEAGSASPSTSTMPRAASYAQLPNDMPSKALPQRTSSLSRSFSENVLANMPGKVARRNTTEQASEGILKARRSLRGLSSLKRQSSRRDSRPQFTISEFTIGADDTPEALTREPKPRNNVLATDRERKARSVSGSISNFARKSWISASRSPSPSPSKKRPPQETEVTVGIENSYPKEAVIHDTSNGHANGHAKVPSRRNSLLRRGSRRPLSSILSKTPILDTPSVPPIPKSLSTDKLLTFNGNATNHSNPAVPSVRSFERLQNLGAESPRKKDPLWSAFRGLDGEHQKFQSRPSTLKTAIVRSALLPFLRTYADHHSTFSLRPEDLDRRTVIFNKWWTGLLELLNGRHGESVSGNDRPAILEAVTALMVRPEWTLPAMTIVSHAGRTPRASLRSRSTTSLRSTMTISSDFLADSIFHNVRNTFTQNLLAQMAYVVDRMSTRNVPASVVTFCGRATAYAFFYCEGVAEILVRLWATPLDTMRRVLVASGLRKEVKVSPVILDRISATFPPCLQSLKFNALRPMISYLRTRPHVPIATAYIPWHGPWVRRWAGRDTDLFFIFAKFYTDLVCRFLPDDASVEETMATPGWIMVQAQILKILDTTLQQSNSSPPVEPVKPPPSITFDEMLGEADATATMLPLPANGAVRSMGENRIIMLLRDCLSGSAIMVARAQSLFAQSFCNLLKAATQRTSVFDHSACFTLCDFLEEAIPILTRYCQSSQLPIIDWALWLKVCKNMLQSRNTMTEVRLCSFLYSMWGTIASDEDRKREVCLEWLLHQDTFHIQFCHWCPMVRAFFMRLIVWRIARLDGSNWNLDRAILKALTERLQETWRHLLYLREHAETHSMAVPSTAPCSPAPARRLYIIRDDVQPAPSGMFLSFDGIFSTAMTSKNNPYERHSSRDPFAPRSDNKRSNGATEPNQLSDGGKKRWSLFKSMVPASNPPKPAATNQQTRPNGTAPNPSSGRDNLMDKSKVEQVQARLGPPKTPESPLTYQILSFKFSLEWTDPANNPAGRERRLNPPKLPLPSQLLLDRDPFPPSQQESTPLKPEGAAVGPSKYTGRALAEWSLLINECQNFFERRRAEGVPTHQMVETPTLGVENFRKI